MKIKGNHKKSDYKPIKSFVKFFGAPFQRKVKISSSPAVECPWQEGLTKLKTTPSGERQCHRVNFSPPPSGLEIGFPRHILDLVSGRVSPSVAVGKMSFTPSVSPSLFATWTELLTYAGFELDDQQRQKNNINLAWISNNKNLWTPGDSIPYLIGVVTEGISMSKTNQPKIVTVTDTTGSIFVELEPEVVTCVRGQLTVGSALVFVGAKLEVIGEIPFVKVGMDNLCFLVTTSNHGFLQTQQPLAAWNPFPFHRRLTSAVNVVQYKPWDLRSLMEEANILNIAFRERTNAGCQRGSDSSSGLGVHQDKPKTSHGPVPTKRLVAARATPACDIKPLDSPENISEASLSKTSALCSTASVPGSSKSKKCHDLENITDWGDDDDFSVALNDTDKYVYNEYGTYL